MSFESELDKSLNFFNLTNKKNLFKYTEEFPHLDIIKILDYELTNNKFYLSYENGDYYLGIGYCTTYYPKSKKNLLDLCNLKYNIFSSGIHQDINLKFFGGVSFNLDSKSSYPWEGIPKSIFFIPEILIFNLDKKSLISFNFLINQKTNRQNIIKKYYHLKKTITQNTSNKNNIFLNEGVSKPNQKQYIEIFNKYIQDINNKKIDKIVLSRMKIFNNKYNFSLSKILEKMDKSYTRFLFSFNNKVFLGLTPEKLVINNNQKFSTEALAGTLIKKTSNILKKFLTNKKEMGEHQFVIDYIKEKLHPLSNIINQDKPKIKSLGRTHHLCTQIKGKLKQHIHIINLLYTLYPTPAVLGLPNKYVLKQIIKNEPFDRGWYSGCIGWFDNNGNGRFDVSIRSGLIHNKQIHLFSGGGIVRDSQVKKEWLETEEKFNHLLSSLK